jgi:tetratricopeptide (TPR) repeat protein
MLATAVTMIALVARAGAQPATSGKAAERAADAEQRFQRADYLGAAEQFKAAYALDADPGYLFDIAQAYRLAGKCADAADYYARLLAQVANPPHRDKIDGWLADQQACARREQQQRQPAATVVGATVAPPPPSPPPPPPPSSTGAQRTVAWGLGIAGMVSLAVGAVFTAEANNVQSEWNKYAATCSLAMPCTSSRLLSYDHAGNADNAAAITGYAIGAAAIAAGVTLYIVSRPRRESPIAVAPTHGGAMAVTAFSF